MTTKNHFLPECPVETTLLLLSSKWKVLILRELYTHGAVRFSQLQRGVGNVSRKVLTTCLKSMVADGLVSRQAYNEKPLRVEYSLTTIGQSLEGVITAMEAWGTHYQHLQCTNLDHNK